MAKNQFGPQLRRWLAVIVGMLVAVSGFALPAIATPTGCQSDWDDEKSKLILDCKQGGQSKPGESGRDGSPVSGKPSCELTDEATFCVGEKACWIKENDAPYAPPKSTPPEPDAEWVVRLCAEADGTTLGTPIWLTPDLPVAPPLIVQARQAIGRLELPSVDLTSNPPGRSFVNLETRFGLEGGVPEPVTGSSAFDVVAIATPHRWRVTPGDGGAAVTCPVAATSSGEACAYTYARSSVGQKRGAGGQPAFRATSALVWTIEYRDGDDVIDIPGAVTTVDGPTTTTEVPVAEIQTVVTGGG